MRAGQPGPQPAKTAGPTAKLRASGPRPRALPKKRPGSFFKALADLVFLRRRGETQFQHETKSGKRRPTGFFVCFFLVCLVFFFPLFECVFVIQSIRMSFHFPYEPLEK